MVKTCPSRQDLENITTNCKSAIKKASKEGQKRDITKLEFVVFAREKQGGIANTSMTTNIIKDYLDVPLKNEDRG